MNDYKYEPDPIKRREQRRERARIIETEDPSDAEVVDRLASDPPGNPMFRVARWLSEIGSLIQAGAQHREKFTSGNPEEYELLADLILESAEMSEAIVDTAGEKLRATAYGNLATDIRLLLVRTKRAMHGISDNLAAHLCRSEGSELSPEFWIKQYESSNALASELEYMSYKIEAAAADDGTRQVGPVEAPRKHNLFKSGDESQGEWLDPPLTRSHIATIVKLKGRAVNDYFRPTGLIQKTWQNWIIRLDNINPAIAARLRSAAKMKK